MAGCIGVILFLYPLLPEAFVALSLHPPVNGSDIGGLSGNETLPDLETENETVLLPEPLNDDERLEALIARTSVPLLELAAGEVYSAHIQDDAALRDRAADICSLAGSARLDASALDVSPGVASAHADFIAALDEFIAAGTLLDGSVPLNQSVMDEALGRLVLGAEHLSGALRGCRSPDAGSPETEPASMSRAVEPAPAFPDALQIGERFCYDDASGANSGSLIVVRVRTLQSFYTTGLKPQKYTAKPGESFLLVAIKATHLGHKGDGTNSRLQTPRENAFTLHYSGETYRPMPAPGPTNQGDSYSTSLLERHESRDGYLFFEVPEDFDPSHAYLEANIGKARPVWHLDEGVTA
jgi:hypothetical protein